MSFAESYVLASKVRSKLTKEAANPKTSLRSLVLQANMLDNLMDHIAEQAEKKKASKVSFAVPEKPTPVTISRGRGPLVTEYELESDSDSDSDFDSDSDYDSGSESEDYEFGQFAESDEEDDYYYSSDEEDTDVVQSSVALASVKNYKKLPVIDLSGGHDLLVIFEEQEDGLPELSRSTSDSESEDEVDMPNYSISTKASAHKITSEELFKSHGHLEVEDPHRHQRHNAIYSMEHVF